MRSEEGAISRMTPSLITNSTKRECLIDEKENKINSWGKDK